ncbi:MAG: amidohydrolase [Micrococcaceae bacterium]
MVDVRTLDTPDYPTPNVALASLTVDDFVDEIIEFRRELHEYPELSNQEFDTTKRIAHRLQQVGLEPILFKPSGLMVDVGAGPIVAAFRGDIDALPLPDLTELPFASKNENISHACGHDVHTAVVLGVALTLNKIAHQGKVKGAFRFIFQPAEEIMPGGAEEIIPQGALEGVPRILSLHCDPRVEVGKIGLRVGPLTSASSVVKMKISGRGGHTSRPQMTEDLVYAMSKIATEVPTVMQRKLDARNAAAIVWGTVRAGYAPNAIPKAGVLEGTLRCLDKDVWFALRERLPSLARDIGAPYGVKVEVEPIAGVAPVVNTQAEVDLLQTSARNILGENHTVRVPQSMGGEDFSAYLEQVPGAMMRLGTHTPGGTEYDLHQGDYTVDERCIETGMKVLTLSGLLCAHAHG